MVLISVFIHSFLENYMALTLPYPFGEDYQLLKRFHIPFSHEMAIS
jgi:hypothetical protein